MRIDEVKRNSFYQFPQWLLNEPYSRLGDKAKMMYMLLFDRRGLSVKNKWHDEDGKIYMYFTNEQFMQELSCSEPSIIKAKKELADFGLLKEVRQGINKPNRLYLFGTKETLGQELKKVKHGTKETLGQDLKKVKGINTNNINTNISINTTTTDKQDFGSFLKSEGLKVRDRHITQLLEYVGLDHMDLDLVKLAVIKTTDQGIDNPSYTFSILENWKAKGILTVEQQQQEDRRQMTNQPVDPNAAKFAGMEGWN
ncbi:replication initiator protein A [Streptococcus caballi]|uniref:replication initiator protein A n=1 Tax=Streptococcus caballi TaxID=439220 RepID=UPI0003711103|nr:replication initiator protein A [Streptococcus caballi]